jgi:hypothetical protein
MYYSELDLSFLSLGFHGWSVMYSFRGEVMLSVGGGLMFQQALQLPSSG